MSDGMHPELSPSTSSTPVPEIKKVQVGCGPHNILPGWWNVDIRSFPGIDHVMDVTQPWSFHDLDYVYGEHFLEHLNVAGAIAFLNHAWHSLRSGGVLRLSTPSLEWVLSTHFSLTEANPDRRISSTFQINRAFHGWGHQFLYSKELLTSLLDHVGYHAITYCEYGSSAHSALSGLERHGGYSSANGYPSVWIVEASKRGDRSDAKFATYQRFVNENFLKYLEAGH
ncbi:MAG: class I SAM-dependent methyltransferase [Elainellaceae cyanobacterium]